MLKASLDPFISAYTPFLKVLLSKDTSKYGNQTCGEYVFEHELWLFLCICTHENGFGRVLVYMKLDLY